MHICVTLALRDPLMLCGSVERPNLHLSCHRKPCEDRAQAARMLCDIICGDTTPLVPFSAKLGTDNETPAAVVYCVSRAEALELSVQMQADPRLKGQACPLHTSRPLHRQALTGPPMLLRGYLCISVPLDAYCMTSTASV